MIAISFGYHHQSQFLSIIFSDYHFIDLVSSIHFGCRFHHGSFLFTGGGIPCDAAKGMHHDEPRDFVPSTRLH